MAVKDAVYQVDNGSGFDEIHFKTKAKQVLMASGVNIEDGFLNNKNTNGYTKLPNGMMMQWGAISIATGNSATVTFPVNFTTKCLNVTPSGGFGQSAGYTVTTSTPTTSSVSLYKRQTISASGTDSVFWLAIGY